MKLGELVGSFIAVGLFIIAIITFASEVGVEYGYTDIMNDTTFIDVGTVRSQLGAANNTLRSSETSFREDTGTITDDGDISSESTWGSARNMMTIPMNVMNIVTQGVKNVLGIDPIVTASLIALLSLISLIAVWRFIKTGDG